LLIIRTQGGVGCADSALGYLRSPLWDFGTCWYASCFTRSNTPALLDKPAVARSTWPSRRDTRMPTQAWAWHRVTIMLWG